MTPLQEELNNINEEIRKSNELMRVSNENYRVNSEINREREFAEMKVSYIELLNSLSKAIDRAKILFSEQAK